MRIFYTIPRLLWHLFQAQMDRLLSMLKLGKTWSGKCSQRPGRMVKIEDEQQLLSDVVSFLGMHPDRARRLSEEAMGVPTTPPPEEVYLDMLRQALMDGELAEDEMVLIKTFQTAFEIDEETHTKLLEVAKSEPALPPHLETYKATLATAMEDGIITKDEDSMLQTLRKSLNVSESEHATLLANLMDQ